LKGAAGTFTAHVSVGARAGAASGKLKAAILTLALVSELGIEVSDDLLEAPEQ
jgi:hypothetical protein